MLIQGGMISSGRFSTFSVAGVYWISCISSFWKITLPGVIARFLPTANFEASDWRIFRLPWPASMSSASMLHAAHEVFGVRRQRLAHHLRIGQHEVRRRDRVADLLHVELGLVAGVLVELGVLHQPFGPLRGEQIGLLEEVVELVRRPFGIGEALVARRGLRPPARTASPARRFDRRDPEFEIGLAEPGLDLDRALRVGEPVFGDLSERLDHVGDLVGRLDLDRRRPRAA